MTYQSDIAISVRNLSKAYTLAHNVVKHTTATEALIHWAKNPFRRTEKETFWALKDVSFDVQKGDVVGVIGRNGAGKSTLLKILSRITEPTRGQIDLHGRVGSLLEVGTGFHPELTGRENIYMNGAILGMTKREIAKHFDAIVDFAGVEQFLDTPVKRYSSGMYVRLAFAVAAHLNPEILIVDEVLAVGDAEFQKKCLGKMQDVAQGGRTVLFVSHNMQAVSLLCSTAMVLRNGSVSYFGNVPGAIDEYQISSTLNVQSRTEPQRRPGVGQYRFAGVSTPKDVYGSAEDKEISFEIRKQSSNVGRMFLSAHIVNHQGVVITQCDSRLTGNWVDDTEVVCGTLQIGNLWLPPGSYRIDMFICGDAGIIDAFEEATCFEVSPVLPYPYSAADNATQHAQVLSDFQWHYGTLSQAQPLETKPAYVIGKAL